MAPMAEDMGSHKDYLRPSAKSAVQIRLDGATFRTSDGADVRRYRIPQRSSAPICEICGSTNAWMGPLSEPQMAQMSADMESQNPYLRSSAKSAV
jgi:hypothetical protein